MLVVVSCDIGLYKAKTTIIFLSWWIWKMHVWAIVSQCVFGWDAQKRKPRQFSWVTNPTL